MLKQHFLKENRTVSQGCPHTNVTWGGSVQFISFSRDKFGKTKPQVIPFLQKLLIVVIFISL